MVSHDLVTLSLSRDGTIWGCAVSFDFVASQKELVIELLRFTFPTPCPTTCAPAPHLKRETVGSIVLILCAWRSHKLSEQDGYAWYLGEISLLLQSKCFFKLSNVPFLEKNLSMYFLSN